MLKLPVVSGEEVVKAFRKKGFNLIRQRGSHMIVQKVELGQTTTIPIPNHDELSKGTFKAILRRAEISVEEFVELL